MNIIILASLSRGTGNNSTAERIRDHLMSNGLNAILKCTSTDFEEFSRLINDLNIKAVIGIHAYRAGKLLQDCRVPYALVFGGTDLNEQHKNVKKLKVMTKAVNNARVCISFSESLKRQAGRLWEGIEENIIIQPQAICPHPAKFLIQEDLRFLKDKHEDILNNNAVIFLLVAGLRPVKDPLFLVKVISEWHREDKRIHLVIVGPELDEEYSLFCKKEISSLRGVVFINAMEPDTLSGFMRNVFALINSSTSEGMANSILEAMYLGTPVIARRNDGNEALIKHRQNGFLFDSPQDFKTLAQDLLSSTSSLQEITKNARDYISKHHSFEKERSTYNNVIKLLST